MEPWQSELSAGRCQAAWDLFAERYRRLILATIRRLLHDHDDVMDVFAFVCSALGDDDMARLRRFTNDTPGGARFSTWLVAVVRNLSVDWLRKRDGRRRVDVPDTLSARQQSIYTAVFVDGRSHLEAYESIATRTDPPLRFRVFLQDLRELYRLIPSRDAGTIVHPERAPSPTLSQDLEAPVRDPAETAESVEHVSAALATLASDVRLAVQLFVVEQMPAADVARVVGWSSAKTVYNKVYRALDALRSRLERAGIGHGDL